MQPNISRREFSKRLAGGAALLALQSAWNYRAAAQSLRNDLKDLSYPNCILKFFELSV